MSISWKEACVYQVSYMLLTIIFLFFTFFQRERKKKKKGQSVSIIKPPS